jgi:hypothetical protein
MSVLTKEQIQKLTPEQQEAVASLALDGARRRTLLLERARRYRGQVWVPALAPAILLLVFFLWGARNLPWSDPVIPFAMVMIVDGIMQVQITGINRRLDALIELLEADVWSQKAMTGHEEAEQIDAGNGR